MEGEIRDVFPLFFRSTSFQHAEPVVYPFLGQALASLRRKDVDPFWIAACLKILIQRLTRFIHQIDIAPLASLVANMEPPDLWTDMSMDHLEPGDITDPTSCPVAEREECGPPPISFLLDQRAQNIALIVCELTRPQPFLCT